MEKKTYETYKKVSTLGVGSFGTAYLVECQSDKSLAVIKQIDIQTMSEEERRDTLKEAKILEALNHPNIVRFREVYKTKKGKLCIVMDFADGGDLQSKIKDRYKQKEKTGVLQYMSEDQVLNWFTQIALAMKHVHDRKILHRDLKSQNIFLTKKGMIKLGDFGIAKVLSHTKSKAKTVVGTPYYLSPEIIKSESYGFSSDIWSLGVLLYEMCALCPPFNAQSLHQLAQKIVSGKFAPIPSQFSPKMTQLINQLLIVDPKQRLTINQILQVPIVQQRIQKYLGEQDFKDEFSHTLLHNQNVFDDFKKAQKKLKEEAEAKQREADEKAKKEQNDKDELRKKMEQMYIKDYKPPQQYNQKYSDQEFFNYQYMKYVGGLEGGAKSDSSQMSRQGTASSLSSATSSTNEKEDREDNEAQEIQQKIEKKIELPNTTKVTEEQMINITSCDFKEFANYMRQQYGQKQFDEGFKIIQGDRNLIIQEDGEKLLTNKLNHLFSSEDMCKGFINFCTTYLIVQNMNFSN